jgi:DNA primase
MSTVDEIKARLDIVDVVGSYVKLQRAGRVYKAPCPFHSEKTPSFVVTPDRQSWHCFGACSTGGDLFTFVQKKENVDFSGALEILARRAGVEIERRSVARRDELKPLYDANDAAAIYFHSLILAPSNPALAYAEGRGIDRQALNDFQIGFSAPGWEGLRDHLTGRGFTEAQLLEAGLLVQSERGGRAYDRFRGRLMFPIRDDRGRVIGFGARTLPGLDGDGQTGAKYINTPQTPIFDKGGTLYALDRARDAIRTSATAVIVEGYMDVVAAHQFGFRNVVASMGTALTERQVASIEKLKPDKAVFAMDADAAGNAAALRDVQLVISSASRKAMPVATARGVGMERRLLIDWLVAALPGGVDPDDLVRRDPKEWEALIAGSKPVVDHLIEVVAAALDLREPRDRAALVAEVMPAVRDIADPVVRSHYIQRVARLARVDEETLRAQAPARRLQRPRAPARPPAAAEGAADDGPAPEAKPAVVVAVRAPREEFCLALLYRHQELCTDAETLDEDLFTLAENRELFRRWRDGGDVSEDEPWLFEQKARIDSTLIHVIDTDSVKAAFSDCVARMEQARMKAVKEASALALAEGEASLSHVLPAQRGRTGEAAAIAKAQWEAGTGREALADADDTSLEGLASQLLKDTEAGLRRFHRSLVDSSHGNQGSRPTG